MYYLVYRQTDREKTRHCPCENLVVRLETDIDVHGNSLDEWLFPFYFSMMTAIIVQVPVHISDRSD